MSKCFLCSGLYMSNIFVCKCCEMSKVAVNFKFVKYIIQHLRVERPILVERPTLLPTLHITTLMLKLLLTILIIARDFYLVKSLNISRALHLVFPIL